MGLVWRGGERNGGHGHSGHICCLVVNEGEERLSWRRVNGTEMPEVYLHSGLGDWGTAFLSCHMRLCLTEPPLGVVDETRRQSNKWQAWSWYLLAQTAPDNLWQCLQLWIWIQVCKRVYYCLHESIFLLKFSIEYSCSSLSSVNNQWRTPTGTSSLGVSSVLVKLMVFKYFHCSLNPTSLIQSSIFALRCFLKTLQIGNK